MHKTFHHNSRNPDETWKAGLEKLQSMLVRIISSCAGENTATDCFDISRTQALQIPVISQPNSFHWKFGDNESMTESQNPTFSLSKKLCNRNFCLLILPVVDVLLFFFAKKHLNFVMKLWHYFCDSPLIMM